MSNFAENIKEKSKSNFQPLTISNPDKIVVPPRDLCTNLKTNPAIEHRHVVTQTIIKRKIQVEPSPIDSKFKYFISVSANELDSALLRVGY